MSRPTRIGVVVLVATSAPAAFTFESLIRQLLLPPEFEDVRVFFAEGATMVAWGCVVACVFAALAGYRVQRRWTQQRVEAAKREGTDVDKAVMDRTFLSMSIPQVPAIASTVAFMSGGDLWPVIIAMVISSSGVIAQGIQWEALLERAR
jgi:hypothetical protein